MKKFVSKKMVAAAVLGLTLFGGMSLQSAVYAEAQNTTVSVDVQVQQNVKSNVNWTKGEDADITAMAGAKYTIGWEDINEKNRSMSATLVIRMENVNWDEMTKYIDANKTSSSGYNNEAIWAFGEFTKQYVPTQPHMRLKALNIGKQNDGSVLINSLQIMEVDTLDEKQKELAYNKSKKEAENFAKFLIANVPGFSKAKFGGVADELYVRETRHIVGEEKLTVEDILLSKRSARDIAMGSYAIDVQTTSIYDWGYIIANPIAVSSFAKKI